MARHQHNYQVQRRVYRKGKVFYFLKCRNPGCPEPDKLDIRDDERKKKGKK